MSQPITIETGARLHFGLLSNSPELPRKFGGAGVMVSGIGYWLRGEVADTDAITGPELAVARVQTYLNRCRESGLCGRDPQPCRIEIEQAIPPHAGFGSGTQLGLATARLVTALAGADEISPMRLAQAVGRGLRSALGIHGFERGGLLIDGGKSDSSPVAPLVGHAPLPNEWRFVLITPQNTAGLSGEAELKAFAEMDPMPVRTTEHLCRILMLEMLPAVIEADFTTFCAAVSEYGRGVGEYFAPYQGGVFSASTLRNLSPQLHEWGFTGIGQTSWGPTMFVLCEDDEQAQFLIERIQTHPLGSNCDLRAVAPMNTGATLSYS